MKQLSDLDFNSTSRIRNLPAPVAPDEPIRMAELNSAIEGLAWKDSVRVRTQSNTNLLSPGATLDGITMVSLDRVLVANQTTSSENGIYIWNGSAVAMTRALDASTADELESAVVAVDEGTNGGTQWRQTSVNFTIGVGAVAWVSFGTSAPTASETTAGIAEIATQAETDTGTDDARFVTPQKLATWSKRALHNATLVGDGSATQYDVTHNFGTRDTIVRVYRNSTPWDDIGCDVERPDANTTRVRFSAAPTTNQFNVVTMSRL